MIAKRVLVIGLGLIGASLASALKEKRVCQRILGSSRSADTVAKAVQRNIVDAGDHKLDALLQELEAGDVVVIATPTLSVSSILQQLTSVVSRGVIITDVASVKGSVVNDSMPRILNCLSGMK